MKLSFGLELEFAQKSNECDDLISTHRFAERYDASVTGVNGGRGYEVVTPVYFATISSGGNITIESEKIAALCKCAALVNSSCGLHVHVGKPARGQESKSEWTPEQCLTWLITGQAIEETLYALCPSSRKTCQHAKPIQQVYAQKDWTKEHPAHPVAANKYSNTKRYCWLNIVETVRPGTADMPFNRTENRGTATGLGTVEIRMLGNVRRHAVIEAWLRMCLRWGWIIATNEPLQAITKIAYGGALSADIEAIANARGIAVPQGTGTIGSSVNSVPNDVPTAPATETVGGLPITQETVETVGDTPIWNESSSAPIWTTSTDIASESVAAPAEAQAADSAQNMTTANNTARLRRRRQSQ